MSDIFISYSRRDADFAMMLRARLAQEGRDSWLDVENIPPSSAWRRDISEGIERSQAIVFVLSPDWLASPECAKELAHALQNRKRVIPVLSRPVEMDAVPVELREINWVSFVPPNPADVAFKALLAAVDTDLEWVRAHTRLQLQALQWEHGAHDPSLLLRGSELRAAERLIADGRDDRNPALTALQVHHVSESRRDTRRRRTTLAAVAVVALLLLGAASWIAIEQQRRGDAESARAEQQGKLAISERARAVEQEKLADTERARANEQTKVAELQAQLTDKEKARADLAARQALEEGVRKREQEALKHAAEANRVLYRMPEQALLHALRGWQAAPREAAEATVRSAVDEALSVMRQRRTLQIEEAKQWGSGESYIAPTWFSGRLSARLSPDGRYALLTTERGASGAEPPGDVYLLNNETLKLVKLDREYKFTGTKRRLEYTGFGSSGQRVYVARQYQVEIYSLTGALLGAFDCPCTKYPINLIDGIRNDQHLVVADTDGGAFVLAAENTDGYASILRRGPGGPQGRTVLRLLQEPSGQWALLLRGNGSVHLWQVADRRESGSTGTRTLEVPTGGRSVAAAFAPAGRLFATGGEDGTAAVWQIEGATIPGASVKQLARLDHAGKGVGFLAFSGDGIELLTVSDDGIVRVWDPASGKLRRTVAATSASIGR